MAWFHRWRMRRGRGVEKWIERRSDGWWVFEIGGGWSDRQGPYRFRLWALLVYIFI